MSADERVVYGAIIQELWVAARYGREFSEGELRAVGVEPDEYGFISFVGWLQPVTRTRLAQASGLRRTTLRDRVGRLIERGHVEERPHPEDGRASLLTLTPAGQDIFDRGRPAFLRVLQALDAALGGEIQQHEDAVRRVRVALETLSREQARRQRVRN